MSAVVRRHADRRRRCRSRTDGVTSRIDRNRGLGCLTPRRRCVDLDRPDRARLGAPSVPLSRAPDANRLLARNWAAQRARKCFSGSAAVLLPSLLGNGVSAGVEWSGGEDKDGSDRSEVEWREHCESGRVLYSANQHSVFATSFHYENKRWGTPFF